MNSLKQFFTLESAEEYFDFFEIAYDPKVLAVNRLHILKLFSRNLVETEKALSQQEATESQTLLVYRNALQQAYQVFLHSTPGQQRLFKVFQQNPPGHVLLHNMLAPQAQPENSQGPAGK